jgi:hypothetical protein
VVVDIVVPWYRSHLKYPKKKKEERREEEGGDEKKR